MEFKLGELFSGPGGLALGAGLAGTVVKANGENFSIKHIWGVDKDKQAIETYRFNIVKKYGGCGIPCDALEFCKKDILDYPRITALAFGFPCNDFSLVGKQKGVNGQYGELYKAGIEAINKMNPYWFIAENVSGIHSANQGEAFQTILQALKNAGTMSYGYIIKLRKILFFSDTQR